MKPSGFSLSVEAARDVSADKRMLIESMKILFPLVVILNIAMQSAVAVDYAWAAYILIPFNLLIYGCFALSWHRYALRGFSVENTVNPLRIRKGDGAFMFSFAAIMGGYSLVLFGMQNLMAFVVPIMRQNMKRRYMPPWRCLFSRRCRFLSAFFSCCLQNQLV